MQNALHFKLISITFSFHIVYKFFMNFRDTFYRITHWETWHYLLKYVPIMPVWLWYCIKARSFWFFTPSNPTLTFGGFEGESKREMYEQLPAGTYPSSTYISYSSTFEQVQNLLKEKQINFPFAVKPDVGMMGFMFRKMESENDLKIYHEIIKTDYIIQDYVNHPLEVSVFYYRFPGEEKGTITGFLKKEFLSVTGDGISTIEELIDRYPRARFRLEEIKIKHREKLTRVLAREEVYYLSYALNLSRGGKLVSLAHEIDAELRAVFDALSHYTRQFYYGRYDIKCASIMDLKKGKNYSILEYNGCGAEPHHAYGNGNTLFQAYGIFLHHWQILYKISRQNRRVGVEPWKFQDGLRYITNAKKHFRRLKALELATKLD